MPNNLPDYTQEPQKIPIIQIVKLVNIIAMLHMSVVHFKE